MNTRKDTGVLLVASFDGYFDIVDRIEFSGTIQRIKKLPNNDLYFLSEGSTLWLIKLIGATVQKIHQYADVVEDEIVNFAFSGNDLLILHKKGHSITHLLFELLDFSSPE